ncbi:MAG TPA: AraC family transcriptional regulator ligand-binding domain-containing protein [Albitalea sp.]|uniref:helix-turn-helix domain-containing protein n=1 Tax=Piscinibacter sp. TaxID=1903157 RepID=UPI002ED41936
MAHDPEEGVEGADVGTWTESHVEAERWDDLPGLHVLQLAEAYRRRGIDVAPTLPLFGVRAMPKADTPLDYRRTTAWIEHVLAQWPVPGLGFDQALRTRLPRYGIPGYTLLSAETFGRAIELWLRHAPLFRPSVGAGLRLAGDRAEIFVVVPDPPPFGTAMRLYCIERWLAYWRSAMRGLLGEQFFFSELRCAHDELGAVEACRQLVRGPVHFDSVDTALVFPRSTLDAPTRFGNAEVNRICATQCELLLSALRGRGGLSGAVRRLLLRRPVELASPQAVAEALSTSERSLRRRLLEEGSSFSDLLHAARMELALDHLRNTSRPIAEVAQRLGYADETAFARAFKRRYGQTPRAARHSALAPPFGPEPAAAAHVV